MKTIVIRKPSVTKTSHLYPRTEDWDRREFNTTVEAHNYYIEAYKYSTHIHLDYGTVAIIPE